MSEQPLVTAQSLALSLSAPRFPPLNTVHRNVFKGLHPGGAEVTHHHGDEKTHNKKALSARVHTHHGVHERICRILENAHNKIKAVHPHLGPDSGDQFTRSLGHHLPLSIQHRMRDDGSFRTISDRAVTLSVPSLAIVNHDAARRFLQLTQEKNVVKYGKHKMQFVDLFLPKGDRKGFVFFVHGGAWGSGMPWMYRLCATPFLEADMVVAIVGYRTYPDGNVQDQVDDLESAAKVIATKYPHLVKRPSNVPINEWMGITLMGHSSGAHISALMAVERIERCIQQKRDCLDSDTLHFDNLVGLSGVYSISHHFDFEAMRGVEQLSPMMPCCGYTRDSFDHFSPAIRLQSLLSRNFTLGCGKNVRVDDLVHRLIPDMLLIHGVEDSTVPFTSTSEAARIFRSCGVRSCKERYQICGHPDVVMQLMLGGLTRNIVMDWIQNADNLRNVTIDSNTSKL